MTEQIWLAAVAAPKLCRTVILPVVRGQIEKYFTVGSQPRF